MQINIFVPTVNRLHRPKCLLQSYM